ncbi:galanin receptor type 1 [Protopterus annectens]|uniref:galanin receptor type 1 n=1 Tax=Protopterus annectens TaxID=7888 RepID=UPI001CFA7B62|nr:galanin receptor type 1 [Protopterus annectens]
MEKEQPRLNRKTEWTEQRTLSLNGTGMKGNNSFAFLPFQMGSGELPILLVFSLIFVLGVVGNSLVITVLARSKPGKPRSTTNIFILNLSIADLAYLLFCVPFQATIYVLPYWVLGAFICKFIHYFFTVSMLVSIFTLSAMSVDRYFAIVHCRRSASIRVARNALTGVIVIWILSVIMASPVPYNRVIYYSSNNLTFCWERWSNPRNKTIYVVCRFVFGYLLPLLLISFCYTKIQIPNVLKRDPQWLLTTPEPTKYQGEQASCHPFHQKRSIVKGQLIRAARMTTLELNFQMECDLLRNMFEQCGYPCNLIQQLISEVSEKRRVGLVNPILHFSNLENITTTFLTDGGSSIKQGTLQITRL